MAKKKKEEYEGMVLYMCPYCGAYGLKSLIDIRSHHFWSCVYCGHKLKAA